MGVKGLFLHNDILIVTGPGSYFPSILNLIFIAVIVPV